MFMEDVPLELFYDKEGGLRAVEYVVACPWSSGPMIFTGLLFPDGPSEFNWTIGTPADGQEYDQLEGIYLG
jgi:hypothetical protein